MMTLDQAPGWLGNERREHMRIRTRLLARHTVHGGHEFPGTIVGSAGGGSALIGPTLAPVGSHVVTYIDKLGQVDGRAVGPVRGGGFAVRLANSTNAVNGLALLMRELEADGAPLR